MNNYLKVLLVILTVMFLNACSGEEEIEDIHMASFKDIDSVYLGYGSINIDGVSAEIEELEANLFLNCNGKNVNKN